jgi:signal transduction histidine kinase
MKHRIIILFVFCCSVIGAQNIAYDTKPIAELNEATTPKDSVLFLLGECVKQKNHNLPLALNTVNQALEIAKRYQDEGLINKVKYDLSLYLFMLEKNRESRTLIEEILPYFKRDSSRTSYAILLNRLGKIAQDLAEYEKSIELLDQALGVLKQEKKPNFTGIGFNYLWQSDMYILLSEYEKAIVMAQNAYEYFEKADDKDKMSAAIGNFVEVQLSVRHFSEARLILNQILSKIDSLTNRQFMVKPINMMGIVQFEEGETLASQESFMKALDIINELGNFPDLPKTYLYLSKIAEKLGDRDEAFRYANLALEESKKTAIKKFEIEAKIQKAQLLCNSKKYEESKLLLMETIKWSREKNDKSIEGKSASLLSQIAEEQGNYKLAYENKKLENKLEAELLGAEKVRGVAIQQLRFEMERASKEREVEAQLKDLDYKYQITQGKNRQRNLLQGLAILGIMAAFLIRSNLSRQKINKSLSEKNSILSITEKSLENKNVELEKYIESNIQLQQFAHIASHDLKSPLRTVASFIGLLKRSAEEKLSPSEMEYINIASTSVHDMYLLVEDLLSYSKVNALQLTFEEININELVSTVLQNVSHNIEETDAKVEVHSDFETMKGDSIKLRQVLQNIVVNGLKFVDEGVKPEIKIDCTDESDHWLIKVKDNGIGISKDYAESIFEPFKQLNNKRLYSGTGLGLALCKKIVEKHSGKIWVSPNERDKGSTFFFTIAKA